MAVQREESPFCLRNLQEIAADAGQADRLCGGGALVGRRHFLEIVVIHAKQKGTCDEKRDQGTHDLIVFPTLAACKYLALARAEEGTRRGRLAGCSNRNVATAQAGLGFQLTV